MRHSTTLCSLLMAAVSPALAQYSLIRNYSGPNFFEGWDFLDGFDNTTNGDVNYLSQANATADNLVFVNNAGNAIIKVDNTSFVPFNFKRNSVKIISHDYFPIGSVFLFDALHLPFGCSVWPSFWTMGQNWPHGGEIDIMEGVNRATSDQMTLHANPGCVQAPNPVQLGKTAGADCSAGVNSSNGCTVLETQPNSYGEGFNDNGGGVWAAQFDVLGIFVWFWNRSTIPADVSSGSNTVNPSTWGTPSAAWPSSSCNISEFFAPQQLVIDITLCGDFAGQPNVYQQTCGGSPANTTANTCVRPLMTSFSACCMTHEQAFPASKQYIENVINNGTAYADAFFEIRFVQVFAASGSTPLVADGVSGSSTILVTDTSSGTATGSAGSSTGTSPSGNGNGGSGSKENGVGTGEMARVRAGLAMWGATLCAAFIWVLL
ncbi:Glycoside Hydrolase Family 16 protein [Trametes cinnabarina]|uniref:Glycoside Hydrolase Family 16 protein n=1 Tax=Pycnoporus cinnabarinus TaxID=5643 RepID=A0A060S3L5_PYCCI|nr:Glycoside Hydrolase Family 16 protein [Trametes cinnabarina]